MFASQQDQGCVSKRDGETGKDVVDNVADNVASSWAPLRAELPAPAYPTWPLGAPPGYLPPAGSSPTPQRCCWSSWSLSPTTTSLATVDWPGSSAEGTSVCGPGRMKGGKASGLGWGAG